MKTDVLKYPLSYARADMLEYLFSGSIISAVKALTEDSAVKKRKSSEALSEQATKPESQGTPGPAPAPPGPTN